MIPVLNSDGTVRRIKVTANGVSKVVDVTMMIPVYRSANAGGDTKGTANIEYRIPLFHPITLVLFTDAGIDRLTFSRNLQLDPSAIARLNRDFDYAGFEARLVVRNGSQRIRVSSGVELQAWVPKLHAPIRFSWAYNPVRGGGPYPDVCEINDCGLIFRPILVDYNVFPNYATAFNAIFPYLYIRPHQAPRFAFRAAIGFSF
jgi:hypothetical protein